MNIGYRIILAMIIIFNVLISCHNQTSTFNIDMEKQLVEKAIHNSIGWAKNKDIDLLYSVITNDEKYIEVSCRPHYMQI